MKLKNQFQDYLLSEMTSEGAIKIHLCAVKHFVSVIGDKPIKSITEDDLFKYKLWCIKDKKYQPNTICSHYGSVNNYLKMGHNEFRLKSPKPEVKNVTVFTKDDVRAMFKVVEHDLRLTAILKTMYFTWIRRFEVCNLNVEDIDWAKGKLRINKGKGNRYDVINIHPDALESVKKWLDIRDPKNNNEQSLFLNKWGQRITKHNIHQIVKSTAVKAKITKRAYPHLFRISGITHSSEMGVGVSEIAKQSRHRNIQCLLERYIRPNDGHIRKEYLRGISLDIDKSEPKTEPVQQQQPVQPQPQIQQPQVIQQQSEQAQSEKDRLVEMLLKKEITTEAFTMAMNTINDKKENGIYGYQ